MNMEEKCFRIEISGTEKHTWQGVLRTAGQSCPFQSELELLLLLGGFLEETPAGDTQAERGGGGRDRRGSERRGGH